MHPHQTLREQWLETLHLVHFIVLSFLRVSSCQNPPLPQPCFKSLPWRPGQELLQTGAFKFTLLAARGSRASLSGTAQPVGLQQPERGSLRLQTSTITMILREQA